MREARSSGPPEELPRRAPASSGTPEVRSTQTLFCMTGGVEAARAISGLKLHALIRAFSMTQTRHTVALLELTGQGHRGPSPVPGFRAYRTDTSGHPLRFQPDAHPSSRAYRDFGHTAPLARGTGRWGTAVPGVGAHTSRELGHCGTGISSTPAQPATGISATLVRLNALKTIAFSSGNSVPFNGCKNMTTEGALLFEGGGNPCPRTP